MAHILSCSFCRRSEHEVEKLVAGVGVYICDGCVRRASEIMESSGSAGAPTRRSLFSRAWARLAGFAKPRGHRPRIAAQAT
jgi:ATP-dependent Clp protease ATP-binding subunit ClpX